MYFLGIDIGTTNIKVLLLSDQLQIVAEKSAPYDIHFLAGGGVEQSPDDWWKALCHSLHELWKEGIMAKEIEGIAVSGHGVALVVTDESGATIRPAISSLDTRCQPQTNHIRRTSRKLILERNGNNVGAFNFEPKLLWLKETEPEHYRRMPTFLSPTSYITFHLTGKKAVNFSDGGMGMAFDRRSGSNWSPEIIESMGLDIEKFPELVDCSDVIGTVHGVAAEQTGLPNGIPVIAGGEDTSSAALAMGVVEAGMAYTSLGTQGTVGVCTDQFAVRPEILGFPHVLSGLQLLSGSMSTFGAGMQWFVKEFCKDLELVIQNQKSNRGIHELLMDLCQDTDAGAKGLLFLPYLSGELHPVLDENAAGVFFGLRLEHTREDMARAVMEGAAHAIRHNLHYAEQVAGSVQELRAVGGPTRNPLWCQIIADVTQTTVKVMNAIGGEGGAPLGNALLVMSKMRGENIRGLLEKIVVVQQEYTPNREHQRIYNKNHEVYKQLYFQLKDLFPMRQ